MDKLNEAPEFASALANEAPAIMWLMDATDGRYLYISSGFRRFLGHSEGLVLKGGAEFMLSLMHPEDVERVLAKHNDRLAYFNSSTPEAQDHYVHEDEYRMRHKNGQWRWIRSSARIYERTASGQIKTILGVGQDVTDFKRIEEQLRMSDRMATVGHLAAGVAHEINNPLSHLISQLELLGEGLNSNDDSELEKKLLHTRDMLKSLCDSATRIAQIVRDLKTLSRPNDSELGLIEVHRAIEQALPLIMNDIKHRAKLVRNYRPTKPCFGNESKLTQVFLNLLINAVHSIPAGNVTENEIEITTKMISDKEVVIEVRDSGHGISSETISRIFDPFYTTKPIGKGTGLGLSICYNIVTSMGGSISVTSPASGGSLFQVRLPVHTEALGRKTVTDRQAQSISPRSRMRVLIVDDDEVIASSIAEILSGADDVTVTSSGKEAFELITSGNQNFDVVLCDLMMPEMTGADLYERVIALHPELAEKFFFITGGALSETTRDFLRRFPNRIIEKPFRISTIREIVSAVARVR